MNSFVCPICGNTDIYSIGYLNGKPYCRKCISFKGEEANNKLSYPKRAPILLSYELSPEQQELSNKLVENYKKGIDSLVYAVCGSGKTEIVLQSIKYAINCGEKVAFAIPRRDVCIELYNRLRAIFKFNKVICVYGGHHETLEGDIIVLTTHQLYRYQHYFSLIILDEIDAFPFKGNEVLDHMFHNALKGHYILMSATPDQNTLNYFQNEGRDILRLDIRFHRHPLSIPRFIIHRSKFIYISLLKELKKMLKESKPVFIFAPTIEKCESLFLFLNFFFKDGNYVHSKRENRSEIIENFKTRKKGYLVTTSVLERGVTLENLQVIVFESDHSVYDSGTLIQIAGRVGRKKNYPDGEVIFLANKITQAMKDSVKDINKSNEALLKENRNELL